MPDATVPLPPPVTDIKVFVPAKDFQHSLAFYTRLGWTLIKEHAVGLAELELAGVRMFLQDHYNKDWAENFMFYINVPDAQQWYEHVSRVLGSGEFPNARVREPQKQSYGDWVTYVWDPSGVLLHFAQAESK